MNEVEHAAAVRTVLSDAIGEWDAYDFDDEPEDTPQMYALMQLTRTVNGSLRMCGGRAMREWRLDVTTVGDTVDEVRWLNDHISAAIDDKRIASIGTTALRVQTDTGIRPDNGKYSGTTERTYYAPV